MAAAVANSLAYEEIDRLKTRLEEENLFLRSELDARDFSGDIVGSSARAAPCARPGRAGCAERTRPS